MKTSSLLIGLALWGVAYLLIRLNFTNGAIEIGRGVLGAYIFPFAPFLMAIVLVLASFVIFATAAARPGQR